MDNPDRDSPQQRLALKRLADSLERLFPKADDSRTVVTRAGINDRLIDYTTLPLTRWAQIVDHAIRQHKLGSLVEEVSTLTDTDDLRGLLRDYERPVSQGGSSVPPAPPSPPTATAAPAPKNLAPEESSVATPSAPPSPPSSTVASIPESAAPPISTLDPTPAPTPRPADPPVDRSNSSGTRLTRPVGGWGYAALAGIGLVASVALLLYLARNATMLLAGGTMNRVYYLVLIIAGLASAAFLFGAMQSYAEFKGAVWSGNLTLGGPVVVAALVVVGGMAPAWDGVPDKGIVISAVPDGSANWETSTISAIDALEEPLTKSQRSHLEREYGIGKQKVIEVLTPEPEPTAEEITMVRGILRVLHHIQKKAGPQEKWTELTAFADTRIPNISKEIQ